MLQPRQFVQNRLFARPSDLRAEGIEFTDGDDVESLRYQKMREATDSGLAESIAREGVQKPVTVFARKGNPWLTNGHHRYFVAEDQGDKYLPIDYVGAGKQKKMWKEVDG